MIDFELGKIVIRGELMFKVWGRLRLRFLVVKVEQR